MDRSTLKIFGGGSRMDARRARLAGAPERARPEAPIWEPQPTEQLTTSDVLNRVQAPALRAEIETALVDLLTRPIDRCETHHRGYALRERAIRERFAALDVGDAYELARRLDVARANDPLVSAFGRLTVERRLRLRAFLEAVKTKRRAAAAAAVAVAVAAAP